MKMSGSQFLETLQQLGYPGAEKLDPQMFDWLFEQENIVPFLHWFSNNVHSNNVLSASDRNEYDELEKCNEGILEGRQLEDALNNLTVNNRDADITEESLSEDITRLNSELEDNKEKKQMLIQRRNRLSLHHTSVSHKLTKLTPLESCGRKEHKKRLEQIQTDNNKVNESMEKLVDSVKEVTSLYDNTDPSQTKDIMFLSQAKLDDYFNAEEKYTQELTSFTRKQFFENIGRMTGENDGSRFELLDVKDPEMLLIHGESDENVFQDCKELTRLQNVYNRSESDKILAILEDKGVKGALNSADDLLSCLQSGRFPVDTNKLSTQLQEAQSSLQNVRRDLHNAKEGDLPLLVKELVPLQGNPILTGDYNLKLARQDYFTSNQDKLINLLISQKARYEFLTIAYEVEARHHRDIHRHLTAVRLQLQSHLKEWKNRMSVMEDPVLTSNKYERGTIDTRDTSTSRLHQIIDQGPTNNDEKQLFLTYSSLLEGGEKLHHCHQASKTTMLSTATKYYDKIHLLESNLKTCEETIYKGSSTTSGHPVLSPPHVQESIKQLEDLLQKLEASIVEKLREINNKKAALQKDNLLMREKTLFVDFLINPGRIQQALEKLSNRLHAMSVQ